MGNPLRTDVEHFLGVEINDGALLFWKRNLNSKQKLEEKELTNEPIVSTLDDFTSFAVRKATRDK